MTLEEVRTSETILKINGESELSSGEGFVGESSEETSVNVEFDDESHWILGVGQTLKCYLTFEEDWTRHNVGPLLVDICLAFSIVSPP